MPLDQPYIKNPIELKPMRKQLPGWATDTTAAMNNDMTQTGLYCPPASEVVATRPKLTITNINVPGERLNLFYEDIQHVYDANTKQVVNTQFSLTFAEVENLAVAVKNAKKHHAKYLAERKRRAIKNAQNNLNSANTTVKVAKQSLAELKKAR